jgi:predicted transcriptional regulator of viral defense system
MGKQVAPPSPDVLLAALARRQHGVVTWAQLLDVGLGPHGIAERVRTGRLRRIHRGVYAVSPARLRTEGYWLAAVLACGSGAVLSHRSAAALWELRPSAAQAIDVTVPSRSGRKRRRGIKVHRSSRLTADEIATRDGIPVTTVARTLLDLADVLPTQALKRAIDEAEYRGRFDLTSLHAVVQANPGRRGAKLLDLVIEPVQRTRSELEDDFLAFCRRHRLPRPTVGATVAGFEVDFVWRASHLIVETDGLAAHRTRRAFEDDRTRDRRTLRAGYRTVRLTDRAISDDERDVARDLRALLSDADTNHATYSRQTVPGRGGTGSIR